MIKYDYRASFGEELMLFFFPFALGAALITWNPEWWQQVIVIWLGVIIFIWTLNTALKARAMRRRG